jgi:hypothetical protein
LDRTSARLSAMGSGCCLSDRLHRARSRVWLWLGRFAPPGPSGPCLSGLIAPSFFALFMPLVAFFAFLVAIYVLPSLRLPLSAPTGIGLLAIRRPSPRPQQGLVMILRQPQRLGRLKLLCFLQALGGFLRFLRCHLSSPFMRLPPGRCPVICKSRANCHRKHRHLQIARFELDMSGRGSY